MNEPNETQAEAQARQTLAPPAGSTTRRIRKPWLRALRKWQVFITMALAARTESPWRGLLFIAVAYGFLWMIEADGE